MDHRQIESSQLLEVAAYMYKNVNSFVYARPNTVDREIFVVEKFSPVVLKIKHMKN